MGIQKADDCNDAEADPSAPAKRTECITRASGRGRPRPEGRDDLFGKERFLSERDGLEPAPTKEKRQQGPDENRGKLAALQKQKTPALRTSG